MTTFDEREMAFEAKFAHDEETRFKAQARCNKKLGLWAAEFLGLTGTKAETYAQEVITAELEEPGHEDVIRKLAADLSGKVATDVIRSQRRLFLSEAIDEIMAEAS